MSINTTIIKPILLILFISFFAESIDAQRSRTRSNSRENTQLGVKDKLWYGIYAGNLGFSNGGFSFSMKGSAAYKLQDAVSAGVHAKFFYDISSVQAGPDISLFSYGSGLFARVKFLQQFFIHGEYNLTSYDGDNRLAGQQNQRDTYNYPMVGGGYESGYGPWKGGIMLLFNLDEQVREIGGIGFGEYWLSFSYNF